MARSVVFSAVRVSLLPVPEPDFENVDKVPPRFAKMILEMPKPAPPPPMVRPEPEELQLEPKIVEEKKLEPEPIVKSEPIDRTQDAREKASVAGLLPFADALADLRDNQALASVTNERDLAAAAGEGTRSERSLITSRAGKASGGINTAIRWKPERPTGPPSSPSCPTTRLDSM